MITVSYPNRIDTLNASPNRTNGRQFAFFSYPVRALEMAASDIWKTLDVPIGHLSKQYAAAYCECTGSVSIPSLYLDEPITNTSDDTS